MCVSSRARSLVFVTVCALVCAHAGAAAPPLSVPTAPAARNLLDEAEQLLDAAQQTRDPEQRFRLADQAVALCERAAAQRPKDPEPILRLVRALTVADPQHPENCRPGRCEAALLQLAKVHAIDPHGIEAAHVASEQGIILSRMRRFEEAMAAYERAMPLVDPERRPNRLDERPATVILWGNSAETAMALGRLDDAIRRYELARDRAEYGESEWLLALYGLGVALDRDGQVERARRVIEQVLERDPTQTRIHEDSAFFEPPGDIHYYEGLAHEVAGDGALAEEAFGRYLAAQPEASYARRARAHLAELAREKRSPVRAVPTVDIGVPMVVKSLRDKQVIRARIREHERELKLCYTRALRERPGLVVRLQLALEISPSGFVGSRAHVLMTSEPAVALTRCVELSAEVWRFPPIGGAGARDEANKEEMLVPLDFSTVAVGR